jgi:phosphoribosylamine--glycine ligase
VVVEELLEGREVSAFALCDGATVAPLSLSQDFKRVGDGDTGPNTGGMGAYAPVPFVDAATEAAIWDVADRTVQTLASMGTTYRGLLYVGLMLTADGPKVLEYNCRFGDPETEVVVPRLGADLAELAAHGHPFVGTLFAGLMLTADGPKVLEYNCRFGDPETQSLMPLLGGDLLAVLAAAAAGDLERVEFEPAAGAAVTVVLAGGDYPAHGDVGSPITGIEAAEATGALVFHAGTALHDGAVVTNGGRVLNVTAMGDDIAAARTAAYAAADLIAWDRVRRREDIALAASIGTPVAPR